jgi:hypothetical protein
MTQIVHTEAGDSDEVRDLELATAISHALEAQFSNHYWLVSFAGHNLIIRHVLIASLVTIETGKEGFGSLLPRSKIGTVHEACKVAVRFAGALLEAFKLPRGAWDGVSMPVIPEDLKKALVAGKALRGWGNN